MIGLAFVSEDRATLNAECNAIEVCCKCSSSGKYRFCEPCWGLVAVPMSVSPVNYDVSSHESSKLMAS